MKNSEKIVPYKSSLDACLVASSTVGYNAPIRDYGVASGWVYDNRGGFPRESITESYGNLTDVSDTQGTALIRKLNLINAGTLDVETSLYTSGNGVSLEFWDKEDKETYKIILLDNNWYIIGENNNNILLVENAYESGNKSFTFRIHIDFENKTSTTFIDNKNVGTHSLLSDNTNSFRFATSKESKIVVTPGRLHITSNYAVYESFDFFGIEEVYGWKNKKNAYIENSELWIDSGSIEKNFCCKADNIVFQTHFKCQSAKESIITLLSSNDAKIVISYKDNNFYANGKLIYNFRYDDMWIRIRVEADYKKGVYNVLINGKNRGKISFDGKNIIDSFKLESFGGISNFEHIRVFTIIEHDDYVPTPTTRADLSDYIVGLNICSLWVNGNHFGWSVISPYEEHVPVLGYYDEGVPETADWEIKYMVEHGIDYQAFCWYQFFDNGYLKPRLSEQLHEAFMYAKYSDHMYFTINWETWGKKLSIEEFKNKMVPYWFENYFIDDRYLKLDNKVVFNIYAPRTLRTENYFGSIEGVNEAFDYMNDVAKSYGFDGMIFLESDVVNTKNEAVSHGKAMGFTGAFSYHWQNMGYLPETNIGCITMAESGKEIYNIPTISCGYDGYVWRRFTEDKVRVPVATHDDFKYSCEWVKNKYLPKYKNEKESWKRKMVMLSTWNEYGEGTFIMPSGQQTFAQLDAVSKVFPNGKKCENIIPNAIQKERINHQYPQDLTLLRRYGYYVKDKLYSNESSFICEFVPAETKKNVIDYKLNKGHISISGAHCLDIELSGIPGTRAIIRFATSREIDFSNNKTFIVTIDSQETKTYHIRVRENYRFDSYLLNLKVEADGYTKKNIHNFKAGKITVRSAIGRGVVAKDYTMTINDKPINSLIYPEKVGEKVYFPFDTDTPIEYLLNTFVTWNRYTSTLKIASCEHTAIYTVDKSTYILDGVEKDLGYSLYLTDGLPMMDFEKLCDDFGFDYITEENSLKIKVKQSVTIDESKLSNSCFVFEDYFAHRWSSSNMVILPEKNSIIIKNSDNGRDPQIFRHGVNLEASKYKKVKIRCRYKYEGNTPSQIEFFFTTDKENYYSQNKCMNISLEVTDTEGEWKEFTYDLTSLETWKDTITNLRFDPFSSNGFMELDYIKFI